MPNPAKGLYAPRIVDATFALMGLGSAVIIVNSSSIAANAPPHAAAPIFSDTVMGLAMLACLLLVSLVTCLFHSVDRKGWDDYMGSIVNQSAMIGMVTLILFSALFDIFVAPAIGGQAPSRLILSTVPIACLGWSLGYLFLRWKGTNA